MSKKTVRADEIIHEKVVKHTEKTGSKIGKFYDRAAQEKLDRDAEQEDKNFRDYETK